MKNDTQCWVERGGAVCTTYDGGTPDGLSYNGRQFPTFWTNSNNGVTVTVYNSPEECNTPVDGNYYNRAIHAAANVALSMGGLVAMEYTR